MANGSKTQYDFYTAYQGMVYSFPKYSLRMHWLENTTRSAPCGISGEGRLSGGDGALALDWVRCS
jgi:hypothetical protein